jgi:hypothetical protein
MPKRIPEEELGQLVALVSRHPDGVQAEAIREGLGFNPKDRTLQRRLNSLEAQGRIRSQGTGKGKRYFPITPVRPEAEQSHPSAGGIRLSSDGQSIKDVVTLPITERTPVGYQSRFLESYEPNKTSYLSDDLRHELLKMGKVGQHELPAGTYLRQVMDRLIIDLSWNSSRLEGNTYSLLDTQRLLEQGEKAEGKAAAETQMILNHKAAIEMLAEQADEIGFNRHTVCNLHALLGENLLPTPEAGGRLRSRLIGIAASVYEPLQVPQQIEGYFDQMLQKAEAITDPFEQSFFIMVHLPYLQPFEDVNKRVSRLAANIPMIRHNLCPLSFVDVSEEDYVRGTLGVYELMRTDYLRDVYVWAYRRSCARYSAIRQSLGEPDPFRLRYRELIGEYVRGVVQGAINKRNASMWIAQRAKAEIDKADQARFQGVVETELNSLHEGNIARYRLRQSEYTAWSKGWK